MSTTVDVPPVCMSMGLIGAVLLAITLWLSMWRARSPHRRGMTPLSKYVLPLMALAVTSCVTGIGFGLSLATTTPRQTDEALTLDLNSAMVALLCSIPLFVISMLLYILSVWFHETRSSKSRFRRDQ